MYGSAKSVMSVRVAPQPFEVPKVPGFFLQALGLPPAAAYYAAAGLGPSGPRPCPPNRRWAAGGTTPGPEDQGPPVLGPVGGAHRPPWPQDGSSGQGWDRRWAAWTPGPRTPSVLGPRGGPPSARQATP